MYLINQLITIANEMEFDLFRFIANNINDLLTIQEPDGKFRYISPSIERILGYSPEEYAAMPRFDTLHPEDAPPIKAALAKSAAGLPVRDSRFEFRALHKNGHYIWLQTEATRIIDAAGRFTHFVTITRDITASKRTEQALRESEEQFRQLFMSSPVVKLLVDPRSGSIVEANHSAEAFYGFTREELCRMSVFDIDGAPDELRRILSGGVDPGQLIPTKNILRDGSVRDVEAYVGEVTLNGQKFYYPIIIDVTEKRALEKDLLKSRRRQELVMEAAQAGIWEYDFASKHLFTDERWKTTLGFQEDDLPPTVEEGIQLIHPDDVPLIFRVRQDYVEGRADNHTFTYRMRHKDGSYRWIYTIGKMTRSKDGHPLCLAGSNIDITTQKLAEELRQESQEKLNAFAQAIPDLGCVFDEDGRIIEVMSNNEKLLLRSREELLGLKFDEVIPAEAAKLLLENIRKALATGKPHYQSQEIFIDRKVRTFSERIAPMRFLANGKRTVAAIITDITAQRKAEKMLQFCYELRRRSDILNEVVNGPDLPSKQLTDSAAALRIDLNGPQFCCLLTFDQETATRSEQGADCCINKDELTYLLSTNSFHAVWECRGNICILCQAPTDEGEDSTIQSATRIMNLIRGHAPHLKIMIGVSNIHSGPGAIKTNYRQAWSAVTAARCQTGKDTGIYHFRDLGILQLLTGFGDESQAGEYVEAKLGRLIQYDYRKGTDLLPTLEAILQSANLKEASARLFVHQKTLIFRKKRIEKILGVSIDEFDVQLSLAAAIKLYKLRCLGGERACMPKDT